MDKAELLNFYTAQKEAPNHILPPPRDAVAASIKRVQAKISECFSGVPKVRAALRAHASAMEGDNA